MSPLFLPNEYVKIYLDVKVDVGKNRKDSSLKENTSAAHVWLVLWKAAHSVGQNAKASVTGLGLGLSDFAVLEMLLHKGPQSVNAIGRKVLLTSGSITTAINRLESKALVHRTLHPEDQRARLVELTAKGRRLIECAYRQHALDMEETLAVLSSTERAELIRLSKKLGMFAAARTVTEPRP